MHLGCGLCWGHCSQLLLLTFSHLAPYISKVFTLNVALNTNLIEYGSLSPAATTRAGVVRAEWNQVQAQSPYPCDNSSASS